MKNVIVKTSLKAFFILIIVLSSTNTYAKVSVPETVVKALYAKFPDAEDVIWKMYASDQFIASFIFKEEEVHVFMTNDGAFIEVNIQLNEENIPELIASQLSKIENAVIFYVLDTTDASNFRCYRAKVKVGNQSYELIFDKKQNLISQRLMK
jgi:hypothetical protein